MRILVTGQCTLHWGRMEYGNLGNYAIIEPFVRELHRVFPGAEIRTTFQMSDEFCTRERVTKLPMEWFYGFTSSDLPRSLYEAGASLFQRVTRIPLPRTPYMRELIDADLVVNLSGDIWGENASLVGKHRFLVGILKDLSAHWLKRPVVMLAGSPGPFDKPWARTLAGAMLKRFDLVTNREAVSTDLLKQVGLPVDNVHSLACPAFLFQPRPDADMQDAFAREQLKVDGRPTVGFVLCGWNMPIGPFNRSPRADSEFEVFADAVEFIENELGARVCLMSHNNGFTPAPHFKMTEGRDHETSRQLKKVLDARGRTRHVFLLQGLYDCGQSKALIRQFDMLVSGRIHAAVSALSQSVPTVILDYGHEPKAHKLRGFAAVAGVADMVADPADPGDVIRKIRECWTHRDAMRQRLNARIPVVQDMARRNFDLLPRVLEQFQAR